MSDKQPGRPTTKSVVAYAEQLRAQAMKKMAADPYARPYYPTTAAVRTLVKRIARAEAAKVRQNTSLTGTELRDAETAARMQAPALALDELRRRAAKADLEHREAEEISERSLQRHQRRHAQHARDVSAMRAGLSLGQRLDAALDGLKTVAAAPAAVIDGDRVHGGERNQRLPWAGDPHGYARDRSYTLVQRLEALLEEARSRNLERAA